MKKTNRLGIRITVMLLLACLITSMIPAAFAASGVTVTTGKCFTIKNVGSGKYLNVYGNGNYNNCNVTLWAADGTSGENWKFVSNGTGYMIVPQCATGRPLNIYGDSAKNGSNVCLWSRTAHSTQTWIPEYVSSQNAYIFRSANNKSLVLTADGTGNGANICVRTYSSGNKKQLWTCGGLKTTNTPSSGSGSGNASTSTASLIWPLENGAGSVSSKAGARWGTIHVGTDIAANSGTKILASASGVVKAAGYNSARGYYIVIEHGQYLAVYQHMKSAATVKVGSSVKQGQVIGYVGNTGESYGSHLHFELALTNSLKKTGTVENWLYNDVVTYKRNPTYYSVSRGTKSGSYYALNVTKVQ